MSSTIGNQRAAEGRYDVDFLLGYLAGLPTYSLWAELASCQLLRGEGGPVGRAISTSPDHGSTTALALPRLIQPRLCPHATRDVGNAVGTIGQAAKAVMEEAHARVCERGLWVLNEKRLIAAADLERVQASFVAVPNEPAGLASWLETIAQEIGG